jgi:hypothetical protein
MAWSWRMVVKDTGTGADHLRALSDDDLLRGLDDLLSQSRRVEWQLVAHVGEVDERKLYAREGSDSMFAYCTDVLHLSEHEAYLRIAAGRAAREHPMLLAMLADGRVHLSGVGKLAAHLTLANRDEVLARATHKTKRQIEALVAELAPRLDVPPSIRRLPERRATTMDVERTREDGDLVSSSRLSTPAVAGQLGLDRVGGVPPSPSSPPAVPAIRVEPRLDRIGGMLPSPAPSRPAAVVEPLSPGRYRVQFTATEELREKIERLKAILDCSVPDGDLARIFEMAITEMLARREARRFGRTIKPRKTAAQVDTEATPSRYIPLPVRRTSHERDEGECRFVAANGRRCASRRHIELHHGLPWAHGGDRSPENIGLMCRAHNQYLADVDYGRAAMDRHRNQRPHERDPAEQRVEARLPSGAGPKGGGDVER